MRYATYLSGGRRQVGVVSDDGQSLSPLALAPREAERGVLALIERSARGVDGGLCRVVLALRGVELLAALHHGHEKRGARLRVGTVGSNAAQREERLRATQGIAKDAPRLVHGHGLVEGTPTLGGHALEVAVRVQRPRQLPVHALELHQVDGEGGLDPQACKRVHVDYTVNE
jgi:hypothetical protein